MAPSVRSNDVSNNTDTIRHNWRKQEIEALFALPFNDLMFQAQTVHRANHNPNAVQMSTLLSIKTGACPEDCKYCSQSGHYNTELEKEKLIEVEKVLQEARTAKEKGSTRFCMGAAWRSPTKKDMPYVLKMVNEVKSMGMETCMTLGMLSPEQAESLADAGLDYYNHNLDTSPEYYNSIITTRSYQDRLDTLKHVRESGMKVCAGGILGLGESREDRAGLLMQLANLEHHPESVPVNMLVKIKGTPLEAEEELESFEFIRTIAVARIMMPESFVRLSAGREAMNEQMQSLCFLAGANSIFYGERLLTTENVEEDNDVVLFEKLGIVPLTLETNRSDSEEEAELMEEVQANQPKPLYYDAMTANKSSFENA